MAARAIHRARRMTVRNRLCLLAAVTVAFLSSACPVGAPREPAGRPILLVVVDTLRADRLSLYGYSRPTSTQLDHRSRAGRIFERALATSPWTAPSFGSLFTGELPSRHGVLRQERPDGSELFGRLDSGVSTVPERLSQSGYGTAAFVNNPFLAPEFGLDRGFDLYDYIAGNNAETRRADTMVDLALGWIDAQAGEPFFAAVQLFDPHMNYDAPAPFRGRFTEGIESTLTHPVEELDAIRGQEIVLNESDRRFVAAAYDEEIAFVDAQLARLFEGLDDRGFFDRGMLVITSDHGEELFEHGGFEHGHAMWQELLHVPLIVWGPGIAPGREQTPVSIADVAPTMLEFAGLGEPAELAGRSLWPLLSRGDAMPQRTLFAEHNLYGTELKVALRWPDKLIVNAESGDRWLFDLNANPEEQLLAWEDRASVADALLRELTLQVERDLAQRSDEPPAELGAETVEKLRALGYVD
jgi:arylsulfatase A-like enzyme